MPTLSANGASFAYQLIGDGPTLVLNTGGWWARDAWVYLNAGRFSSRYRILAWDRRNSHGASDVTLLAAASDWHQWADDLHAILHALDLAPAYLYGISSGSVQSLLMAHLYPDDVQGLILGAIPADDRDLCAQVFAAKYLWIADIAEMEGMQAAIDASFAIKSRLQAGQTTEPWDALKPWMADTIVANPENRQRFLDMAPDAFAASMRKISDLEWSRFYLGCLTDAEVQRIAHPTLILPGLDAAHPQHTAERLCSLLPRAEWAALADRYTAEEVRAAANAVDQAALNFAVVEDFLHRVDMSS